MESETEWESLLETFDQIAAAARPLLCPAALCVFWGLLCSDLDGLICCRMSKLAKKKKNCSEKYDLLSFIQNVTWGRARLFCFFLVSEAAFLMSDIPFHVALSILTTRQVAHTREIFLLENIEHMEYSRL